MSNRIVSATPQPRGDTNTGRALSLPVLASPPRPAPRCGDATSPASNPPGRGGFSSASLAASAAPVARHLAEILTKRGVASHAVALFLLTAPAHAVTVQPHVFTDGTTLLDAANMWPDPDHYAPGDKAWTAVERPEPQHGYCWYMRQLGLHVQRDPVDWERRCQVYAQPVETHRNPFGPPLGGGGGSSTPSPIPLPASAWLLIAGVLSLVAMRRLKCA